MQLYCVKTTKFNRDIDIGVTIRFIIRITKREVKKTYFIVKIARLPYNDVTHCKAALCRIRRYKHERRFT